MLYDPLYGICCEIVHPLPHQIIRNNCLEKQCQQKSNRDKYKNLNHIPDQSGEFFYIILRLLQVLLHLLADVTGKHIQRQVFLLHLFQNVLHQFLFIRHPMTEPYRPGCRLHRGVSLLPQIPDFRVMNCQKSEGNSNGKCQNNNNNGNSQVNFDPAFVETFRDTIYRDKKPDQHGSHGNQQKSAYNNTDYDRPMFLLIHFLQKRLTHPGHRRMPPVFLFPVSYTYTTSGSGCQFSRILRGNSILPADRRRPMRRNRRTRLPPDLPGNYRPVRPAPCPTGTDCSAKCIFSPKGLIFHAHSLPDMV